MIRLILVAVVDEAVDGLMELTARLIAGLPARLIEVYTWERRSGIESRSGREEMPAGWQECCSPDASCCDRRPSSDPN